MADETNSIVPVTPEENDPSPRHLEHLPLMPLMEHIINNGMSSETKRHLEEKILTRWKTLFDSGASKTHFQVMQTAIMYKMHERLANITDFLMTLEKRLYSEQMLDLIGNNYEAMERMIWKAEKSVVNIMNMLYNFDNQKQNNNVTFNITQNVQNNNRIGGTKVNLLDKTQRQNVVGLLETIRRAGTQAIQQNNTDTNDGQ